MFTAADDLIVPACLRYCRFEGELWKIILCLGFSKIFLGTAEPGSAGAKIHLSGADNAKYVPILVIAPPSS